MAILKKHIVGLVVPTTLFFILFSFSVFASTYIIEETNISSLGSINDVNITGLANSQVLAYNQTATQWRPYSIPELTETDPICSTWGNHAVVGYLKNNTKAVFSQLNSTSSVRGLTGRFDQGILSIGSTTGYTLPSGTGTRLMWIPDKAAFRVGKVTGDNWDLVNIGNESVALGTNNKASAFQSFAAGGQNIVQGQVGVGLGNGNVIYADFGIGVGVGNTIESDAMGSTASGFINDIYAPYSNGIGFINSVSSGADYANVIGAYNSVSAQYGVAVGNNLILDDTAENSIMFGSGYEYGTANAFIVGFGQTDFEVSSGNVKIPKAASYSGKAVCYLADGTLGHCTSTVDSSGGCTCASN